MKSKEASFESARKQLHQTLRNWHRPEGGFAPIFSALHLFRQLEIPGQLSRWQRRSQGYQALEACIIELGEAHQEHSQLLHSRFVKNQSIRKIAFSRQVSIDQINRLQREAIRVLTQLVLDKDHAAKARTIEKLTAKLPPRNYSALIGRKAIIAKTRQLLASPTPPWMVALTGLGGSGKTAIADAMVRELIDTLSYLEILWLHFESGKTSASWEVLLGKMAVQLLTETTPVAQYADEIRWKLKQKPTLIVLDNLEEEIEQLDWLQRLSEFCNPGKILVTSRRLPADMADIHVVKVRELEKNAAKRLLTYQIKTLGLDETLPEMESRFEQIYRHVGGSPLALKLVAGLLHAWPFGRILRSVGDGQTNRTKKLYGEVFQSTWTSLNSPARKLLQSMMLVDEEGASIEQLEAVSRLKPYALLDNIKVLTSRSLLEFRRDSTYFRYGIHRLTKSFLYSHLSGGQSAGRNKFVGQVRKNLDFWHSQTAKFGTSEVIARDEGNLTRAIEYGLKADRTVTSAANLLIRLHPGVKSGRAVPSWAGLVALAIQRVPQTAKTDRFILSTLHNQLGALQWQVEDYENSLVNFQTAQSLARSVKSHRVRAMAHLGISLVYWVKGDYKRARQVILPLTKSTNRWVVNSVKIRLSAALGLISYAQKHYSTAERQFCKTLKTVGPGDDALKAQLLVNRGLCLQMLGRLPEAFKHYTRAADTLSSDPGREKELAHINLLRSAAFFQLGDLPNAQIALARARRYRTFEEEIVARAYFESSLGRIYLKTNKRHKAAGMLKSAAKLWEETGKPVMALRADDLLQIVEPNRSLHN